MDVYVNFVFLLVIVEVCLNVQDVVLVIEFIYGMLWWLGMYDVIIVVVVDCMIDSIDLVVFDVLCFVVYQLFVMCVVLYVVVNELVNFVVMVFGWGVVSFMNVVFCCIMWDLEQIWQVCIEDQVWFDDECLVFCFVYLVWVIRVLCWVLIVEGCGEELELLFEVGNVLFEVIFVVFFGFVDLGEFWFLYVLMVFVLFGGDFCGLVEVFGGMIWVQDEGFQLVVLVLMVVCLISVGEWWFDFCVGLGGKMVLLVVIVWQYGVIFEVNEIVLVCVCFVCKVLCVVFDEIVVYEQDGCEFVVFCFGEFDWIFVDVFCIGLGVL